MSTNGDQPQGGAGRDAGLRGWFRNLSIGAKIASGILTTAIAVFGGYVTYLDLREPKVSDEPPPPPPPINAQLTSLEADPNVPRQAYLQEMNKPIKGKSSEELREVGMMITADANIDGLQGKVVTVGYTVSDIDGDPELNDEVAQKIEPESQDDNERVKVFVPYPPEAGEYYVELTLRGEGSEELVAEETPDPVFSPYAGPRPPEDPITVLGGIYDTDTTQLEQEELAPKVDDNGELLMRVPPGWEELDQNSLQLGLGGMTVGPSLSERLQTQVQTQAPSDWGKVAQNYVQLGQGGMKVGSSLAASPNLASWSEEGWETPLTFVGASSWMMLEPEPPAWDYLERSDDSFSPACQRDARYNYESGEYLGHYDVWKKCNDTNASNETHASIVNLVAWPKERERPSYMVVVTTYLSGEADIEAASAVLDLDNFDVLQEPEPSTQPLSTTSASTTTSDGVSESSTSTDAPNVGEQKGQDSKASGPRPEPSEEASGEKASVKDAIRGHYVAIGAGNFEKAYSYFGPTYRKQLDYNKQGWINGRKRDQITGSTIHPVTVNKVSGKGASATVDVTFQDKYGTSHFELVWSLVKEDGQWKLDRQLDSDEIE
jgi:hypothetical protein